MTDSAPSRTHQWTGAACLLLSGAAGLFYQQIWSHHFSIVFGSSELATASILGIYLAGLGAGAALALRRCRTSPNPLRTYALLEGLVAISAWLVPSGTRWAQHLYYTTFGSDGLPAAAVGGNWLFQLVATSLLLAIPTLALGASFPYAIRGLVTAPDAPGARTARFYAANTFGAVLGSLAAGLIVVPALGISTATLAAALLSALAAVLAFIVARPVALPGDDQVSKEPPGVAGFPFAWIVLLGGAATLGYEVLWTRLLIHFVGSGLYALSILLAVFLAGLALGSVLAAAWGQSPRQNARGLVLSQAMIVVFSVAAFMALEHWAGAGRPPLLDFEARLGRGLAIAASTLLPISIAAGAAFLFVVKVVTRSSQDAAPAIARAYQWTAVGNLVGAIGVAVWALPALGFAGSALLLAGLNMAVAILASRTAGWQGAFVVLSALVAVGLVLRPPAEPIAILTFSPLTGSAASPEPVFVSIGESASVVVTEDGGEWRLQTNGLIEGSIQPVGVSPSRYLVTRWLGALPFLAHPTATDALLIGLGAGITLDAIPASVDRVAVVEIEPEVVAANTELAGERRSDPLSAPRVELVINDARDVLHRTRRSFDVIISQPSHPWTAGSANLYTREFLEVVKGRLAPEGVLAQWIGLPFVDEALLRSVLATMAATFPEVEVYRPPTGAALLVLASKRPIAPRLPQAPTQALLALGLRRSEDLAASHVLGDAGVRALAEGFPTVTDDHNLLAGGSPRILGRGLARSLADAVLAPHDPLYEAEPDLNTFALVRRLLELGPRVRAERVVGRLDAGPEAQVAQALLAQQAGRQGLARTLALDALAGPPTRREARSLLLKTYAPRIARGGPAPAELGELDPSESAVVAGWRALGRGDWPLLRGLDSLSSIPLSHPLADDALTLRAHGLARSDRRTDLGHAVELLDQLVARRPEARTLLLYAIATSGLGLEAGMRAALTDLASLPPALRPSPVVAAARAVLQEHFGPRRWTPWAEEIVRRLERPTR